MPLQKSVGLRYGLAVAGQQVVINQAEYLHYNPLSDGTVKAGTFCFKKAVEGQGEAFGYASLKGASASAEPLGFVERVVDTYIESVTAESTDTYPEGSPVTVAVRGQFYAEAPAKISADGLSVFIDATTGAITIASAPESGSAAIDTHWKCRIPNGGTSAQKGDLVIFERF